MADRLWPEDDDEPLQMPPPDRRRKKQPPAPTTDGSTQRCIDTFFQAFQAKWGHRPRIDGGRVGKQFKELVAAWGEPKVIDLIGRFFSTTDREVTRTDYGYAAFFRLAQHLLIADRRESQDEGTRHNVDAMARAMRRRT